MRASTAAAAAFSIFLVLPVAMAGEFGAWQAPVNLVPAINTTFAETSAASAGKGLRLYFQSNRNGTIDLWVASRSAEDVPWEPPVILPEPVNGPYLDAAPNVSRDGHLLFFSSTRASATLNAGRHDLYVSKREHTNDDFAWGAPVAIEELNSPGLDSGPAYFENEGGRPQLYFASNRAGTMDLYVSELQDDGTWGPPAPIVELNTTFEESRPSLRQDGLEMVFTSSRGGNADLYSSERATLTSPWAPSVSLGPVVNSPDVDQQASLSPDGTTLYFGSTRPGSYSSVFDVWVTTRSKRGRHE